MSKRLEAKEVEELKTKFMKIDLLPIENGGGKGRGLSCNDLDLLFLPIVKNSRYIDNGVIVPKSLIFHDLCDQKVKTKNTEKKRLIDLFERWIAESDFVEIDLERSSIYAYALKLYELNKGFVKLYPREYRKVMISNGLKIRRINNLRVLLKLKNYSTINGNGYCFASLSVMVESTGLSEGTIETCIDELEQKGLIKKGNANMYNPKLTRHSSNIYICSSDSDDSDKALSLGIKKSKIYFSSKGYYPDSETVDVELMNTCNDNLLESEMINDKVSEKNIEIVNNDLILMDVYNNQLLISDIEIEIISDKEIEIIKGKLFKTPQEISLLEMDELF